MLVLALASGCLATEQRRVVTEDELVKEKVAKIAARLVRKTYEEELQERLGRAKSLELSRSQRESMTRLSDGRVGLARLMSQVSNDPLETFESERKRVLDRSWSDRPLDRQP